MKDSTALTARALRERKDSPPPLRSRPKKSFKRGGVRGRIVTGADRAISSIYHTDKNTNQNYKQKTFVQSFGRGLHVLECLNLNNGSNVNTLARLTGIHRSIVYRLTETLAMLGFVDRDEQTGCYWLRSPVTGLAGGFFCENWIDSEARSLIEDLGRTVLWPISLTVPSGISMVLRCCTDQLSPFTLRKMPIGLRVSIAGTASGRVLLAHLSPEKREQLLDAVRSGSPFAEDAVANDSGVFAEILATTRRLGYATQELPAITTLAVPVVRDGDAIGALCVRYYSSALRPSVAIKRYLAPLQHTAERLTKARPPVNKIAARA